MKKITFIRECLFCGNWLYPWSSAGYYVHGLTTGREQDQDEGVLRGWVCNHKRATCQRELTQAITSTYLNNGGNMRRAVQPYKPREWPKAAA